MNAYPEIRKAIADAAVGLADNGVMSFSGHCNLSNRVDGDKMLLTNIEGHARTATPEMITLLGLDGTVHGGDVNAGNWEIVPMHAEVYKAYPAIGGIVHTHSPHLLAFAMSNQALQCRYEGLLRWGQATEVPVVPWAPRGSEHSVGGILATLERYPDTQAVLLGNHGVLVFGDDVTAAANLVVALEEAAQGELNSVPLGGAQDFPADALEAVRESIAAAKTAVSHQR
jgi:L-ribulose-5-phosphate 4-epimerase